jgi:hypothetical protein
MRVAPVYSTSSNSTLILDFLPGALSTMSTFVDDTTPLLRDKSKPDDCIPMTTVTTNSSPSSVASSAVPPTSSERLASLDQYRGFVILCSLFVPLLGKLKAAPAVFRHNGNFFSIAGLYMRI